MAAEPMRDYTGLDSLLSPIFCLLVMVTVWSIERCLPGRDILFFIPKSWRTTQPLYQLTDDQALKDIQAEMETSVAGLDPVTAFGDKDVDVGGEGDVVGEGGKKDGGSAAAGRRPRVADDSAHAGRHMFEKQVQL
jgi:hypothetical protein